MEISFLSLGGDPATAGLKGGKKTPREGFLYPAPDSDLCIECSVIRASHLRVKYNAHKGHEKGTWWWKVTETSLFRSNATVQSVSIIDMNTETTNSMLVRLSRFFSDRYAYRSQPGYISELVAFGTIIFVAAWPIILVAHAMAVAPK